MNSSAQFRRVVLAVWCLATLFCDLAWAQPYPNQAIRVVVPFAAGAPDSAARVVGQQLSIQLGQPVVIENRPAANGTTGTSEVARSKPDGYTLMVTSASYAVNPSVYRKLPYDPINDLDPVSVICNTEGYILVVNPSVPAKTLRELVALGKNPDSKLSYGSPGVGNTLHIAGALLNARAGLNMAHIPYRGAGPAISDLIGGQIQVMFVTTPLGLSHIQAGRLRPLAYTNSKRASFLPDVPTMAEAGVPNFVMDGGWYALFAPAKMSPEISSRLHREVQAALSVQGVREKLALLGLDPVGSSPAEFKVFLAEQIKKYAELVKQAGIEPQ